MLDAKMMKTYLRYVVPSSLAFALNGLYAMIDGLFLGRGVGDAALAGVNLAYPLVALVLALGTGIGVGGAVIDSIRQGEGDEQGARRAMYHTIALLVAAVPFTVAFIMLFNERLLYLMGARDDVLMHACRYMDVIAVGCGFHVLSAGFIPLLRNRGRVVFAMGATIAGGALNACFDYIAVIRLGLGAAGSAMATVLAQVFVCCCCAALFLWEASKGNARPRAALFKPDRALAARTLGNGLAPFALTLLPEVTTIFLNIACGAAGGGTAQAAFAVISYAGVSVEWVIQGVNDGSQPLISKHFGRKDMAMVRNLRAVNFAFAVGVGLIGCVFLVSCKQYLAAWFGISEEASGLFYRGVAVFAVSLPLYGLNHAIVSNFYAMEKGSSATSIVACEALAIVFFSVMLPQLIGLDGCWASVPVSQALLLALSLVLLMRDSCSGSRARARSAG